MFKNISKKTLLWWVLTQLWEKWPKHFNDQNDSAKNDQNVSVKKAGRLVLTTIGTIVFIDNNNLINKSGTKNICCQI